MPADGITPSDARTSAGIKIAANFVSLFKNFDDSLPIFRHHFSKCHVKLSVFHVLESLLFHWLKKASTEIMYVSTKHWSYTLSNSYISPNHTQQKCMSFMSSLLTFSVTVLNYFVKKSLFLISYTCPNSVDKGFDWGAASFQWLHLVKPYMTRAIESGYSNQPVV